MPAAWRTDAAATWKLGRQCLLMTLISLLSLQARGQNIGSGPSLTSSSSSYNSKGGGGGTIAGSSFRENILSVQRAHQQIPARKQPVSQQRAVEQVSSQRQIVQTSVQSSFEAQEQQQQQQTADAEPSAYGSVRGTPGVDFPAHTSIPDTKFSCDGAPFEPGMYADESTGCQVYHLCYQGRRESFLCGIGTVFNQAIMNCDFWYSVECSKSSQYYALNSELGKSSGEPAAGSSGLQQRKESISWNSLQQKASFRPQSSQRTESLVSKIQQQVVLPQQQQQQRKVVLEESSFSSGSSGKVSAPKSSVIRSQSSSDEASKSFQAAEGKTSARRFDQSFSSQRTGAASRLLSPSRRVASLNEQRGQFASESSPLETLARHESKQQSQQLEPSLVNAGLWEAGKTSDRRLSPATSGSSNYEAGLKSNLIESERQQKWRQQQTSDEQAWRPVFKSKTGVKAATQPAARAEASDEQTPKSPASTAPGQPTSVTVPSASSEPRPAQPDQEPSFSGNSSPAPTESPPAPSTPAPAPSSETSPEAGEVASVPRGDPPPTSATATTASSTATAPESPSMGSDVSSAVDSSQTPAEPPDSTRTAAPSSAGPTDADQMPQTAPPSTTTTTSITGTGTSTSTSTTTTSSTTTPMPSESATTTSATNESTDESAAPEAEQPADQDQGKRKRKRKKKRGGGSANVAPLVDAKEARANASSVEYAG